MNRIYPVGVLGLLSLAIASPAFAQASTPEILSESKVTSVSQLSDVQPADWAFQSLEALGDF